MKDEPAHFVETENCNGDAENYWRQFLICSNETIVCGCGLTKEQAEREATLNRNKVEEFLEKPYKNQLKELVSQKYMSPNDQQEAIKLISKIILNEQQ